MPHRLMEVTRLLSPRARQDRATLCLRAATLVPLTTLLLLALLLLRFQGLLSLPALWQYNMSLFMVKCVDGDDAALDAMLYIPVDMNL